VYTPKGGAVPPRGRKSEIRPVLRSRLEVA
jgi:hypothetical protein